MDKGMMEVLIKKLNEIQSMAIDTNEKVSMLVDEAKKELLTPKEVCNMLKIGRSAYQRYVDDKVFSQTRLNDKKGSRVYVRRAEIEQLIDEGKI